MEPHGICITCAHATLCSFHPDPLTPLWECQEFVALLRPPPRSYDFPKQKKKARTHNIRFCNGCVYMRHCSLKNLGRRVSFCDNYCI